MENRDNHTTTRDLKRRNHELSVLNAIACELNRSVNLAEALGFTLERVAELLGLRTGWIWLRDPNTGSFYLAATRNLPPALAENPARMDGGAYCYCLDTYRDGDLEGAANVNVVECSRLSDLVDGTDGLRHHASIPLYAGEAGEERERKLGVMNVAGPGWRELSPEDLQLLYTVGDLLGIAIERAGLAEKSARLGAAEERNRLAREIHDSIAQTLTATSLQLESADALMNEDPGRTRDHLRRALVLTRSNLEEARRSVMDLRAAPLRGRPLSEALEVLVDEWSERTGIPARLKAVNAARPLPPHAEAALYRITQEALSNAARHAGAGRVTVRLAATPDQVQLTVEDDGRGFDVSGVPEGRYGLVGMRERAATLGGSLNIESASGTGTRITTTVPLERL